MADCTPLFACEGIRFSRPGTSRELFSDLTLSLGRDERIGILGRNGSGKSTLLHIGAGLLFPQEGTVLHCGKPCCTEEDFIQVRPTLGYLLQHAEDQLFCSSILEDVAFGPYNLGATAAEAENKAGAMLRELGLEALAERNGQRLSGGEQKLAALASILAMDVSMLFLDEPTNNLDASARDLLLRTLERYALPALIVSHDLPFLRSVCTSFCLLENGRISSISPSELEKQIAASQDKAV